ncbi:MAG: DNA-processing protein DprA [Usitatibacter sp.]
MQSNISTTEEILSWLRLTLVPGISLTVQRALLRKYGSPQAVLDMSRPEVSCFAGHDVAERLSAGPDPMLLERTMRWLEEPSHRLLTLADAAYPQLLLTISDPPTVLYAQGKVEFLNHTTLAIVGSRNATPLGERDAHAFARAISDAGICIASGLALGIDSAAHRGGLAGRASSIAVMGTGPDLIYPSRNRDLAHALADSGCLVSEFALGTRSVGGNFPRRNRLISGLSRGVLVVEAAPRSGSLITARFALEQGRDIFAIPGSIHSPLSKGCHELIKQGAKLVESAGDVLDELAGFKREVADGEAKPFAQPPNLLLEAMGFAPVTLDQIAQRTGLGAAALSAQMSQLEIEGRVSVLAGGWFQRVERIE